MTEQKAASKPIPAAVNSDRSAGYDAVRNPQLRLLREAWEGALTAKRRQETEAADRAEQRAYDALIDYVEVHGLNATRCDPR